MAVAHHPVAQLETKTTVSLECWNDVYINKETMHTLASAHLSQIDTSSHAICAMAWEIDILTSDPRIRVLANYIRHYTGTILDDVDFMFAIYPPHAIMVMH